MQYQQKSSSSNSFEYIYIIGYAIVIGLFIYVIQLVRKGDSQKKEFELEDRAGSKDNEEIDLYG